jgi:hypothetical protein
MSVGQLDEWLDGIIYQTTRDPISSLRDSIILVYKNDAVLVRLAAARLIYAIVKKTLLYYYGSSHTLSFFIL